MKMTIDNIKRFFVDDIESRKKIIRDFVMDQTNSFEDRLYIWENTPKHLQYQNSGSFHHPEIKDDDWMQYEWWNRYQKIDLTDIPAYHEWDNEKINLWCKGCLDKGVWSFIFDW